MNRLQKNITLPKKTNKFIIFAAIALLLFLAAVFTKKIVFPDQTTASTSGELSNRASEFLNTQSKEENSLWQEQNLSNDRQLFGEEQNNVTIATKCFTAVLPFTTANTHTENDETRCVLRSRVTSPASQLVISSAVLTVEFDELGSISMRRKDLEKFQERKISLPSFELAVRFDEADTVTLFLVKNDILITVAFNGLAQPNLVTDELLISVASAITLL